LTINGLFFSSPEKRLMAFLIDFTLIYLILFALLNLSPGFQTIIDQHQKNMDNVNLLKRIQRFSDGLKICSFIIWIIIGSILDSTKIQGTLGKLILQIRVTDLNGNKLTFQKAVLRNLLKIISSIFFIGFISSAFDKKYQAFHDKIAKSLVLDKVFILP
jgi:uncharacterized RDD family membrane protein YckC